MSYSIAEVISEVERFMNRRIKLKQLPKRPEDIECIRLSNKKLLKAFSMITITSLQDGIKGYGGSS